MASFCWLARTKMLVYLDQSKLVMVSIHRDQWCLSLYRVAVCLEAKGGGRKGRYQGKAQKLERRNEAEALVREHFVKH